MRLAQFYRGPYDGEYLPLPSEEPLPKLYMPKITEVLAVTFLYLYAGEQGEYWLYLYDEFDPVEEIVSGG